MRNKATKGLLWWRVIAAVVAGMLAGSIIMTPAGAHITTSVKHLINKHIKKQFYTKNQSNSRFVLKADAGSFAGFKNGPGDVYSGPAITDAGATIGTLSVPAGNYAVFAKLYLEDLATADVADYIVTCRLEAGADFDETVTHVFFGPWRSPLSLQLVHSFTSAGSVVVKCRDDRPAPNTNTTFRFLKITAMEQPSISNVSLP